MSVANPQSAPQLHGIRSNPYGTFLSVRRELADLRHLARGRPREASEHKHRDCSFMKAGSGVRIERRGTKAGHLYELLGHSLAGDLGVEPYLITLRKDAAPYTSFGRQLGTVQRFDHLVAVSGVGHALRTWQKM